MRLKKEFITYDSGETQILVSTGGQQFSGIVRSNETAAFIINCYKEETAFDDVVSALRTKYGIDEQTAIRGVKKVTDQLREIGALDE